MAGRQTLQYIDLKSFVSTTYIQREGYYLLFSVTPLLEIVQSMLNIIQQVASILLRTKELCKKPKEQIPRTIHSY